MVRESFLSLLYSLVLQDFPESLAIALAVFSFLNLRLWEKRLEKAALFSAARKNSPLSLVLLDIDQFRHYNMSYGYQKGDEVLAAVGELLRQEFGEPLYAARYGSDEFVLVLPGKERDQALEIAEQIRQKVVNRVMACLREYQTAPSFRVPVVSSGLATYPADGEGVLPLSRAAEDDLFRAKYSKGKAYLYKSVLSHISTLKIQDAFPSLQTFVAPHQRPRPVYLWPFGARPGLRPDFGGQARSF